MKKVFVFHEINNFSIFKKTISLISKNYKFTNLVDFINSYEKNICHITFDDGHHSFEKAFEILKEKKIPSTLFISIDKILNKKNFWFQDIDYLKEKLNDKFNQEFYNFFLLKKNNKSFKFYDYLKFCRIEKIDQFINLLIKKYNINVPLFNISLEKLNELSKENLLELGAHTVNHPILLNEENEKSELEIANSIINLSNFLNKQIISFAYPNGIKKLDYDNREKNILKKYGIKYAFTMNLNNFNIDEHDLLEIPRISFGNNYFKNIILFLLPYLYNKLSKTNLPFIKKSEITRRLMLNKTFKI
jgi:peptidoglycan/xylan/chitin deacetylase (PgdA/CDA1 family)